MAVSGHSPQARIITVPSPGSSRSPGRSPTRPPPSNGTTAAAPSTTTRVAVGGYANYKMTTPEIR